MRDISASYNIIVVIDILPHNVPEQHFESPLLPWAESDSIIHISHYPRQLAAIDPTITFVSHSPITAQSQFTVCKEAAVVHTDSALTTSILDLSFPHSSRVSLVPAYWKNIAESPDPTRYTIFHEVISLEDCVTVLFSAMYKFAYPP
ncbi:hypothetical protein C8R43DRAFT_1141401 [Mycena crocata]|nr:hypothetical protein C8R43DRAFT_1141401 [Mycena crocata]